VDALFVGVLGGLGVLLIFDAFTRPEAKPDIAQMLRRMGPKGAGAGLGFGVFLLLTHWPVAGIAGGLLGAWVPRLVAGSRQEADRVRKTEALAEIAARVRDLIRAGVGIQDALAQAASYAPDCVSGDMHRLVGEARVSGLESAGASFAKRLGPDAQMLSSALTLGERLGARNTSEVLDALAESMAARAATLREARAHQTRARLSARIVAATPILLVVAIRLTNPSYLAPFGTAAGQLVLAAALVLIAGGYAAMLRMARVQEPGI
jgi:Flp pilus assembly protein TadB